MTLPITLATAITLLDIHPLCTIRTPIPRNPSYGYSPIYNCAKTSPGPLLDIPLYTNQRSGPTWHIHELGSIRRPRY